MVGRRGNFEERRGLIGEEPWRIFRSHHGASRECSRLSVPDARSAWYGNGKHGVIRAVGFGQFVICLEIISEVICETN